CLRALSRSHDAAGYAFRYAAAILQTGAPDPYQKLAVLMQQPGKIGHYARKADSHRSKSTSCFLKSEPSSG
ncbi:MAG: hypothetical protein WC717_06110, partial [Candidatus Micrarchaeia archaeon]